MTTVDGLPSVDSFRAEALEWLANNLERRDPKATKNRADVHKTPADLGVQRALQRKLYEGGFAGISFPAEFGGRGLSSDHERAFETAAKDYVLPDFGILHGTTFTVCARTLLAHATPEFLRRHIPRMLAGEELWAQFFSEPDAGSDLAGIRTRAVRSGDSWILDGAKIWSSGAAGADFGMCLARTNWDVPKHRGLTWFAVNTAAAGVTVLPIAQINGAAVFCQEFFDSVEIANEEVIGGKDDGWTVAQTMLVFERGFGSEMAKPVSAFALAPDLVNIAQRRGRAEDPNIRQLIAKTHTEDYLLTQLSPRLVSMMAAGLSPGIAAYGKLAAGTYGPIRARAKMEIAGPSALAWASDDPTAAAPAVSYLEGRIMAIAGGTNEVQRNGIGERVLGLPREPSFDTTKPFNQVLRDAQNWMNKSQRPASGWVAVG